MGSGKITVAIQDMESCEKLVIPGGFFARHDYGDTCAGNTRLIINQRGMTHTHTRYISDSVKFPCGVVSNDNAQVTQACSCHDDGFLVRKLTAVLFDNLSGDHHAMDFRRPVVNTEGAGSFK